MIKNILIIGAGRSSTILIKYLLSISERYNYFITIADSSEVLVENSMKDFPDLRSILFDINNNDQRCQEIKDSDIVISMLPAYMHIIVAKDCLRFRKNLVTASYVSKEMRSLSDQAKSLGLIFLNEVGLDPGIDHMSAMKMIDKIKEDGGDLFSFKSFCGGLIHPDYDNNPWNYKFTWNPRNVVLAGQGVSQYVDNGKITKLSYNELFTNIEKVNVLDVGCFEAYANRDSVSYRDEYSLHNISTIFRGTLRRPGYCKTWDYFVQLGLTDDSYIIKDSEKLTYREYIDAFLPNMPGISVEEKFCKRFSITIDSEEFRKISWLDLFSVKRINLVSATPATILQKILEEKWSLSFGDKDMIVMQHQFEYILSGVQKKIYSSLVVFGDNQIDTSMAKTVGLPVAISAKLILEGKISCKGVVIPTRKEIYDPILEELQENGLVFIDQEIS